MDFNEHISFRLAKEFAEYGYDKYSSEQYYKKFDKYWKTTFSIEECALTELMLGEKFIYAPTVNELLNYINSFGWILTVLYNMDMNSYYFIVQNKNTKYIYKQPPCPEMDNEKEMYEWGFEHILNRLSNGDDSEEI